MPHSIAALPLGLLLLASSAAADLYRLEGQLREADSGRQLPLAGLLEVEPGDGPLAPGRVTRVVIEAGAHRLLRSRPEALDLTSGGVSATGDALSHDGARLHHLQLSAELERLQGSEYSYRRLHLEAFDGRVEQIDAARGLPRRFEAQGELLQSHYASADCLRLPRLAVAFLPPPGHGTLLRGGDVALRADATLSLSPLPNLATGVLQIADGGAVVHALPGTSFEVELAPNQAAADATLEIVSRVPPSHFATPSLEALGTRASDAVSVSVDAQGRVRVETGGDLFIDAGPIAIEGLSALRFIAGGSIQVGPLGIQLPEGVPLALEAGESLDLESAEIALPEGVELEAGGGLEVITGQPSCPLAVLRPDGVESLGEIRLRAERITPAEVELRRGRVSLRPGGRLVLQLLGSGELDPSQLDLDSLRFGPRGARVHAGRKQPRLRDLDRDGRPDLRLRFRSRDTGIEPADTSACLTGRMLDGTPILGCSAIQTGSRKRESRAARRALLEPRP